MKFRELLQKEVWSKRSTCRIVLVLALFAMVAVLAEFSFIGIEEHWLTPGERNAARSALEGLDALHDSPSLSNKDFSLRAKQAGRSIDEASKVARTRRDEKIVADLMQYEADIVVKQLSMRKRGLFQERYAGRTVDGQNLDQLVKSSEMRENSDRLKLHKELD